MLKKIIFTFFMLFAEICFSQENEKFNPDFLLSFFADKDFQYKRLKDTLTFIKFNSERLKTDTFYVLKQKWIFNEINLLGKEYTETYDSFDRKYNCQSNERVFEIKIYGTGYLIYYYFKRESGLWYLVEKEDYSN
ncbi:MAG: DUF4348 domain-containing protein [Bacteroidetes bacterium]|nr:DUF4348 domain-containing protein [Bacteroidota bacterium]